MMVAPLTGSLSAAFGIVEEHQPELAQVHGELTFAETVGLSVGDKEFHVAGPGDPSAFGGDVH
jgi:hypothetical protein